MAHDQCILNHLESSGYRLMERQTLGLLSDQNFYLGKNRHLGCHLGVKKLGHLSGCERNGQESPRNQPGLLYLPFAIDMFLTR